MIICNACRYCEGFCAVFPAIELRRTFTAQDLTYLAHLCHNCRDCFYACQYAPPHEFALNVPKSLAELRLDTYKEFCWPRFLSVLFRRNGLAVSLITALSVTIVVLLTVFLRGSPVLFGVHTGENAFYQVIPYTAMVLPFSVLAICALVSLWKCFRALWREIGGKPSGWLDLRFHAQAIWNTLSLKYLDGGGYGCTYPDARFSSIRRYCHHAVFYGFLICLASTTIAAYYDHFLHMPAPYPFWSWPVILGSLGGVGLLVGSGGLLYLKEQMDKAPASPRAFGMDVGFLVLLLLTSLTGLLLLILRETPLMGILLALHTGVVLSLFITLPYGKFIHAIYRYLALVKHVQEKARSADDH